MLSHVIVGVGEEALDAICYIVVGEAPSQTFSLDLPRPLMIVVVVAVVVVVVAIPINRFIQSIRIGCRTPRPIEGLDTLLARAVRRTARAAAAAATAAAAVATHSFALRHHELHGL